MGRGLRLEDISRGKKMYYEKFCVVYLIVRPSVGRASVKTRRCIWKQEDIF